MNLSEIHLGLVLVKRTPQETELIRTEVSTLGAWLGQKGFGIGHKSDDEIRIPKNCQITFIIENKKQAEDIIHILKSGFEHNLEDICIANSS